MDNLPDFEPPPAPTPRKPRPKPTKRRKVAKKKAVVKARKPRVVKPAPQHVGGRYSKYVYGTIGTLMGMNEADRSAVLEIVQGLCNGRNA